MKLTQHQIFNICEDVPATIKDKFAEFIGMYNIGEYIYPDVMSRYLMISKDITKSILDILEQRGYVKKVFQYYCMRCGKPEGKFLTEDVDGEVYCECSDMEIDKSRKVYSYMLL